MRTFAHFSFLILHLDQNPRHAILDRDAVNHLFDRRQNGLTLRVTSLMVTLGFFIFLIFSRLSGFRRIEVDGDSCSWRAGIPNSVLNSLLYRAYRSSRTTHNLAFICNLS